MVGWKGVLPNMRLELTGLLLKESAVPSPGVSSAAGQGTLRPPPDRPQLKRDPLAGAA